MGYWNANDRVMELLRSSPHPQFDPKWAAEAPLQDLILVSRYTRRMIQYGIISHTFLCVIIAALEQTLK